MAYIPNAADAFEVYMLAMTYLDDIPLNAFAPYHLMNVKELLIKGEFLIWPKEELDNQGRYVEPLAACTYDESLGAWLVELISGETFVVRDEGDVWNIVVMVNKEKRKRAK